MGCDGLAAGPEDGPLEPVGKGLRAGFAMMLFSDEGAAGDGAGEARTLNGVLDLRGLTWDGSLGGGICETTPALRRIDFRLGCLNLNIFRRFGWLPSDLMFSLAFFITGDDSSTPGTLSGRGRFWALTLVDVSGIGCGVERPFCCEAVDPDDTTGF